MAENKDIKDVPKDVEDFLGLQGYVQLKYIPGRGICGMMQFAFTVGICYGLTMDSYKGRWCYPNENYIDAMVAYGEWSGEGDPDGPWLKHKGVDGEYVNPKIKQK